MNGQKIAVQSYVTGGAQSVSRMYENPITGSTRGNDPKLGSEPDALGVNAGTTAPPLSPPDYDTGASDLIIPRHADALDLAAGCTFDGMPISCDVASAAQDAVDEYNPTESKRDDYADSPMPEIPSPTGEPENPTTAYASAAGRSAFAHKEDGEVIKIETKTKRDKKKKEGNNSKKAKSASDIAKNGLRLAKLVREMPSDLREKLANFIYHKQSFELTLCQAANETGGVGWRVEDENGNFRGFGEKPTDDLGVMQIKLGSANEAIKTYPKRNEILNNNLENRKVKEFTWLEVRDNESVNIYLATWYLQTQISAAPAEYEGREAVRFGLASYNGGRRNMLNYGYEGNPEATYYADSILECERILQGQ